MATSSSPVTAATNAVAKGTVVFVQGEAYLRDNSGKLSAIKPGDVVTEGQEIVTRNGAVVELQLPGGAKVSVGPNRELLLNDELFATATPERSDNALSSLGAEADKVIQALNAGKDPFEGLEDPAAGLTGGGLGDQTHDFVRLVRVLEEVTPVSYNYATTADGVEFLPAATLTTQTINTPPVAADDNVSGTEDQPLIVDVLANDSDANNDPLVVTSATATNGQVTINPDGSLRYVPNPDFNGPDTVTYTISDGKGGTSTATVTINVVAVNDAPIARPDVATTPEDQPVTVNVLGNDSDPDGDPLSVTGATVDPALGSVVVNPDGTLTFTPTPDFNGPVVITYTVSDGKGGTASSTVTVNVTPVNDNPVANPDVATTLENTPVTVPVLGNDSDPEGNPLTVTGATVDPALGSVAINPDGTLTFTPAPNFNGPVVINYTISDGQGGTATSTVTVNVTPDNAAPVANPDSATTPEDQPVTVNVLGNDSDPDGDPLSVTGASVDPAKGTVVVNPDGTLTFNPAANVNGPVVVTYTIADGNGGTATSTITIDVTPQNDAPVATPDSTTTPEDQPVTVNVLGNDSDPDGDTLTVTGATVDPAKGNVVVNPDGTLTFTPAANINGPVVVTYTIADGNGGTATSTVTIDVIPDADDAQLGSGSGSVKEDTPAQSTASGTLSIVDPDAGETAFQPQTNAAGTYGSFSVNAAGAWIYTIDNSLPVVQALKEGETRTESFTVRSVDGTATTVSLTIVGTNDGPVANPNIATTPEEQPVTINVLGNDSDPDGDTLSVTSASVDPTKGSVTVNPDGTLTFTPAANINGPVVVTYSIADGHGGTASSTVTINVTPVNDNATISTGAGTTQEDTVLLASGTLTITDPDAGEAAFQAQTGTAGTYGSFSIDETGHWAFTLDNGNPLVQNLADGDSRTESFTVRSADGTESTVVITILGTNESIGAPGVGIVKEDNTLSTGGSLSASGGASFVAQPATPGTYGSFTLNTDGSWNYVLNNPASVVQSLGEGQTRSETFPVTLSDGTASTVTITVVGTNDPALIGPGSGSVTEDSVPSTGGILSITDVDGGEAGFRPQTSVAGTYGSFSLDAAGNWTYTLNNAHPDVQALGVGDTLSETFPVQSTDGSASNVLITINGTNDGPVANPNTATTPEDQPVTVNVLGNDTDPDGDTLSVTGATVDPAKGSVVVNADGTLTFNPAANINGPVVVTYTISDGHGGTATSTVSINVTPVADAAVLGTGSGTVKEDTPAQSTASGTLSIIDPDAGEAVFQAQTNAAGTYGSFSVNTAGAWTYTIDNSLPVVQALKEGETRTESFTVRSADGTATTVSLTIVGTNDGPVANPNTATTPEDQAVTVNVLGNDTDPDGDTLTVTSATVDPAKGSVVVNADGTLTFNPAANVNGPVVVTYTIADGKGGTASSTVTIDVTPVNDAPVAHDDANGLVKTDTTPATGNVITNPAGLDTDLDGDTLSVSLIGSAPVSGATVVSGAFGTLTIHPDGSYSYIQDTANSTVSGLAPGATLTDSFSYTVSDGKGGTATAELRITIAGLNTPPIATPDAATTNEDEPVRIAVLGNDSDPEGDPLSITSATVDPTKGSVVVNADGTLTFNPAPNFNGPVVVTYTISDGKGGTATSTVNITVNPVNDAPVANPNAATTPEDQPVTVNVLGNDSDPDGDILSVTGATVDPAKGSVTVNADGTLTFNPAANVNGPVVVTYSIADGKGGTASSTVTINVTPVNDAPVAVNDTASTSEDSPVSRSAALGVLANDSDIDSASLSVSGVRVGTAGAFAAPGAAGITLTGTYGSLLIRADGSYTYTPGAAAQALNTGDSVQDVFSYQLSDGSLTAVANLSITVTGANDAAVITGLAAGTVKEDTAGQLTATGTLAATDVDSPATFTPASAAGTYGSFSIAANGTWTYSLSNAAANVQALKEGDTRTETFVVTTADGTARNVVVTVLGTNEIPTVANVSATGAEDPAAPIPVVLAGNDVDGTVTSLTLADLPANGTLYRDAAMTQPVTVGTPISATGGAVTLYFKPGANWNGETSFHFSATDNNGGNSGQATASITVTPVADAAVLGTGSGSVKEDTPAQSTASGTLSIVDPDAGEAVFQPQTNTAGTYGSFSVNSTGAWTYTIDNTRPVVQALKEGETRTESFTVRSADGTATTVTLTIVGTNDGPVANPNTATTPEDQPVTVNVLGNDTDPDGDTLSVTSATVDPAKGSVVVNADGTLTFNPAANVNGPVLVTYTIADGKGGTASSTVTVNVTPVNDAPVALDDANGLSKTATNPATGNVITNPAGLDSDLDGDTLSVSRIGSTAVTGSTVVNGAFGTLTIHPDGSYSYSQDSTNSAVASLAPGASLVDSFTYTVSDGKGGTDTAQLVLTISGTNTAPVANPNSATTPEDQPVTVNVLGNDTDPEGDTLSVTGATVDPAKGSVAVNADGTLTFNPVSNFNGPVVISYTISDGHGGTATSTVSINVTPVADAAVLGTGSGSVKEDTPAQSTASGTLSIVDPDAGEAIFQPQTNTAGTYGSFSVNTAGAWTYTIDNTKANVQALKEGETRTESFTVRSADSTATTVNLTIVGTNDGPVANPNTATTPEDQAVTVNVLGNDTDPDGDTLTVTGATVDPAKGSVVVNADGTLTFNPAANVNGPVVVTYTIADGKGGTASSTVTIDVTPVNDAPVAVNDLASTSEDAPVSRSAALGVLANDSDIDSASLTVSGVRVGTAGAFAAPGAAGITLTGTYGSLLIRADGSYTYTPGAAAQALNTGDSVQDVFSYQLSDGSLTAVANLSITVTGANDAAVITGLAAGTVKEDTAGQLTATGTLAATDVDSPATFTPASAAGTYGSFSIAANGTWTYTLSNAAANVQALREGDTRTETFVVTTADGTARNVVVTVLGTNEIPTVANVTATGAEDPATPIPVVIAGNDVDGTITSLTLADLPANGTLYRDAAMTQPVTVGTPISATGGAVTLYFKPGANWNGETSFHFSATDNNGGSSGQATASITVTPVADAAVLGTGSGSVKEDTPAQSTASGTLSIVDPDAGEAVFQPQTATPGTYGSFSVNAAGAWTYTIDNTKANVQALKEGETRTESFTVRSADGTATTVTLTIVGTNDGPVANPNTATTPEDQPVTVNVLGNDTDPDGDILSVTGATVDPAKGSVVVNADGTLTFNPAANVNGPVVVTYTIADGKGGTASSTVTINVTPVNDAPVAVNDTASTSEDNPVSRSAALGVLANDSDIDSASLTVSGVRVGTAGAFAAPGAAGITLTGTYGNLLIRADGSYTYTPGAAAQALNTGDSVQDVFSYQLSDGSLTATANLSITVIGANDPAVITGTAAGTVKEDTAGQLTVTGTLTATDVDSSTSFSPANATGTYGSFSMAANGTWTYALNNAAANVQALKEGDIRTETFVVTTADGTTRNVVVTVLGTNEIPTVANVSATGAEDPAAPIPVVLAGSDVDGTVASLTLADLPANGTLYRDAAMTQPVSAGTPLAATGGAVTLYFQPGANWNGSTNFHFTATDNNGGNSGQATANITVTPVNDPPVAIADTGSTNQDTALVRNAASGVLTNDSDIDGGTLGVSSIAAGSGASVPVVAGGTNVSGAFGTLLIAQDGGYTYTPGASAKALTLSQSASDVFTYTVSDGNGGTATTTLTIQVNGLNDAPVIGGVATGNVTEDGTLTAGGSLTISDADTGQSSFVPQTLTGTYGTLTLQSSGNWSYSLNNAATNVQSLKQGEVVQDNFSVHSADGTAKTVTINVTGTNDAPVVGTATVSVSEEGLAGGIADTTGNTDTTNQTTAGGTISVSDVDGNALTVTLTAPTAALSSNGVAITWTGSGTQTLVGSAGSLEIIRATIANDGTQSVKLSGPIDHPNTTQEDVVTLNLGVNVNDGVTTTSSTLVVRVEDDAPKASSVNQSVVVAPQDTNLLIVLDNSGSMNTADGVGGTTRLKSAITALTQLIDTYDALGEVRIRIVTFNSAATSVGTAWTTVDLGKTQLGNVTLGGTTNYDAAIVTAQTAYTSTGKLASGQNVAYFLSDGVPNSGTEIGTADETAWKAFLTANGITSYALGMGAGASQGPLNPIAYDGLTKTDLNASVITDFAQLSNALQATIPQSASGDILSGGLLGGTSGFGGDGGHISSITIEGVTYTYNPAGATSVTQSGGTGNGTYNATTHLLTVRTDDGGTLVVNMSTGSYNYTPRATITTPIVDGFNFVLADKDGDTASASVTFNVSRQAEQVVTLTSTSTVIESSRLGLTGEYYGYNETTAGVTRTHADDTTLGNLDHVSDMTTIVDGRSSQTVVGTYNAAPATGSDATFSADKIDYGFGYTTGSTTVGAVNGNLGNNPTIGTNMAVNSGALYNFLRGGTTGSDASTLTTTTGLGNTTDSGLRFVGLMNVAGGIYDIRVTADDGFRINIGGQTVAMFDNIQSPTARTYTGISMESGLQPIEILYWEQGGNARLRIEVKLSSEADTAYKTLGTDEFALFTPTSAPVLSDLQDIVESSTNGTWLVRTGERLDGTSGNDHITGSDGQDMIYGGAGNDTIIGGSGASLISGGAGNDTLTGGLSSDTFKWSLGDAGSAGAPALDAITDFNKAAAISGGDVLDLGDLLQGESHAGTNPGNLGSYLHFEKSGTDTVVHISSTGGYTGGTFSAGATDQKIVLQGVDLTNSGALSTDAQIIQDLLTKGKLSAD